MRKYVVTSSYRPFKSFLLEDNDIHYISYKKIIQYWERCFFRLVTRQEKVPTRNETSDLWIPRSDALPLSHRDSEVSEVYYEVHMTWGLRTFPLSLASWQGEENIFLYFFTELKTYHLSYFNIFGILLQLNHQYNLLSVV